MEKWIVSKWDHRNPNDDEVVFEGSEEHCCKHATELLKQLPMDLDCMAMSEKDWKWIKSLGVK